MAPGRIVSLEDLPRVIPVFPLDGALLLPHATRPFNIFEPRYLNMLDDAMAAERMIGMVQTAPGGAPERPFLAEVGCLGRVTSFSETGDGRYMIALTGVCRFNTGDELSSPTPYRQVKADYAPFAADLDPLPDDGAIHRPRLLKALDDYLQHRGMKVDWNAADTAPVPALVNSLAMALPFDPPEFQAILEAPDLESRREALIALLEIDADPDEVDHTARQ